MAKRGRFQGGGNSYAGIPQQIIDQIRAQSAGGSTSSNPAEPTPPAGTAPAPRRERVQRMLTAEEIAADPVLSGKLSYDQARINYIRYTRALNKMPLATATGRDYSRKLSRAQKELAKLGGNAQDAERQFFALGGRLTGVGGAEGSNAGWSAQDILNYWRNAGMEDKGFEIVSKLRGYDQYGMDIPGGIDTSKNINYDFGKEYQTRMQSNIAGLNTLQAARLTKLRNLKQSGATLTERQQANLRRLRRLKNG